MKDVTIIIPIHKFDDKIKDYLDKAIKSVNTEHEIMIVGPSNVINDVKAVTEGKEITLLENNESTDLYTQINKGAFQCVTKYFSVLEFDDEYLDNWDKVMDRVDDSSIILPLNQFIKDGRFVAFGNEIAWDAAFIDQEGEIGYITEKELESFKDFNVTGGLIKTEDFISIGGLKPEYKIVTWFELLMRYARANKTIYVVPRVCYSHTVMREDSYMVNATKETNADEVNKLLDSILNKE